MARAEFSKAVKVSAIRRATRNSVVYCEECGTQAKRFQIDHINPDGLTGKPTLENARVLCEPCHAVKTAKQDVPAISKAKRREAKHIGATRPKVQIKSAGFQKVEKPPRAGAARIDKSAIPPLPRRNPFTGEIYE